MKTELDVIYEDNHLLVLNKPALLPTMGVKPDQPSLINLAKGYLKQKYAKPGNVYLGVVSRLDSFVSGVVVFARTSKAAARLTRQFANQETTKLYYAIVPCNQCRKEEEELVHWLAKDEPNHRMMAVSKGTPNAKQTRLKYTCLGENNGFCLLQIELLTGRKHQIRVQFASSGCPIIGDRKYGSNEPFKTGIALHSQSLTVEHPTLKKSLTFQKDPPHWWRIDQFMRKS